MYKINNMKGNVLNDWIINNGFIYRSSISIIIIFN